jgi:hypothetical protein
VHIIVIDGGGRPLAGGGSDDCCSEDKEWTVTAALSSPSVNGTMPLLETRLLVVAQV